MKVLSLTVLGQILSYFKENGIGNINFSKLLDIIENDKYLDEIFCGSFDQSCLSVYLNPWRGDYKRIGLTEGEVEHFRRSRKGTPKYLPNVFLGYKHSFPNSVTINEFTELFLATLAQTNRDEFSGLVLFPKTYLGDIEEVFMSEENIAYYSRFLDLSRLEGYEKRKTVDEFLLRFEKELENTLIKLRKNFIVDDNNQLKLDLHKTWANKVLSEYDDETIERMNDIFKEGLNINKSEEKGFQKIIDFIK